jgi:hypothetical protein
MVCRWQIHAAGKFLEVFTVEAVVVALLTELQAAKIHTADGRECLISRHTDGGCFEALHEGTRVKCVVTRRPRVVLSASVLGHTHSGIRISARHSEPNMDASSNMSPRCVWSPPSHLLAGIKWQAIR